MSCSPFDVRDYFLDELAAEERRRVEAHVKTCGSCREEFDRLRVMQAALRSVVDEEIPQRIAFVSDKIFEPSPWKRGLAAFWNSGARLGFASAAMLSCALVYFAAARPATAVAPAPVMARVETASVAPAQVPALTEQEIQQRIDVAVGRAVSASERRQLTEMVKWTKALSEKQGSLLLASDEIDRLNKQIKLLERDKYRDKILGALQ
jgi:anti-sigma factor RsiW